nr:PQQ-binding-like beta-propeller repeat protein [Kofleriaceae bacterium]
MTRRWLPTLALLALAACGPGAVFALTSSNDNDPRALADALAKRRLPEAPSPLNASHQPRAYVVESGTGSAGRQLVSFDLAAGKVIWRVPADVQSRVEVGGDFVVALEGKKLVARDQNTGAIRWSASAPGPFLGAAADAERAYVAWRDGARYELVGYDGHSGSQLWTAPADGILGAPAAQGGVVYAPFQNQWLTLIDGATGASLARVRGLDEVISTLRVTTTAAYFGSPKGMFVLDARAATGHRASATYGTVKVPPQLEHALYGPDSYDPIQLAYTAADRAHVLWQAVPTATPGPMKLAGDGYAIHYFRYVLGFDVDGNLRWAYTQPRVELVSTAHTGYVIAGISTTGDVVALEPQTGAVRARESLGGGPGEHVLGATFDADGWSPSSQDEPIETIAALVAIARDHDARFDRVKELAVQALAKLPGPQVTTELLAVLGDARAPLKLKDTVGELLVARRDPASLPVLVAQLAVHDDFLTGSEPQALAQVAKAIGGLGGTHLDGTQVAAALAALQSHLDAATTPVPDLVVVIGAMAALGNGAEHPALWSHLLLYHADDAIGGDAAWDRAIVRALDEHGDAGERELLRQVAADKRTAPSLAAAIHDAIGA